MGCGVCGLKPIWLGKLRILDFAAGIIRFSRELQVQGACV